MYQFFSSFQWISSSNETIVYKSFVCDSYIENILKKEEDPTWMTLKNDLYRSYDQY